MSATRSATTVVLLVLVSSCGKPEPTPPSQPTATSPPSSRPSSSQPPADESLVSPPPPDATAVPTTPCSGVSVRLDDAFRYGACHAPDNAPPARDLRGALQARIEITPATVRSGGEVRVRAVLQNTSNKPLELGFVTHSAPMLQVEVTDSSGKAVDPPPNHPPMERPGPPSAVQIIVAPGGEAFTERRWQASRRVWGNGPPGHPVSRVAGPLPPGRYRIRVGTMFHYQGHNLSAPEGWLQVIP